MIEKDQKDRIRISVRNLVEFILRSGDLDNRRSSAPENAMQEGSKIHRQIQKRMGLNYEAEVSLKACFTFEEFELLVEGRADGIITDQDGDKVLYTIDEIKGTYQELEFIQSPHVVHLAQAKCYAFMLGKEKQLEKIKVRMTYCNIDTQEIKYFIEEFYFTEIDLFFQNLVDQYYKWAQLDHNWKEIRKNTIRSLDFPFPYRKGQKELVTYAYQTICHKRKLFIQAPTGVGKTISTIFPTIKAMGEGKVEKIFYLTAKTITRTVADETIELLRKQDLKMKSIVLTAKEKICFLDEVNCNPVACPYAKGHFDRINDAIYEIVTKEHRYTREMIEIYAKSHRVCPFEFALDISLFSDIIIGDYNYLFDPHVYLRRFFTEGIKREYAFLIDEAHNLLERGREMYSAVLRKEDFLELKRLVKTEDSKLEKLLDRCNKEMLTLKRNCNGFSVITSVDLLMNSLLRLGAGMDQFLTNKEESSIKKNVLDLYFKISHFMEIYEILDENYAIYTQMEEDGSFICKLFCMNPKENLRTCMERGVSTLLFSATFLPIQYYKKLLGGLAEDYEVYADSVFDPDKKALLISRDITSKFTKRSSELFQQIAVYIFEITRHRYGNYMIFFPSYRFLKEVEQEFITLYKGKYPYEIISQKEQMSEKEREQFLGRFVSSSEIELEREISFQIEIEDEASLLGFCVLGGIFSEGIDLKNDSLIGAIIVGTGFPQICEERTLLRDYFEKEEGDGFSFAYQYPGMNKVLQSAGRVIRTVDDIGIVALLDYRFLNSSFTGLFPKEWNHYDEVTSATVGSKVSKFWEDWKLKS